MATCTFSTTIKDYEENPLRGVDFFVTVHGGSVGGTFVQPAQLNLETDRRGVVSFVVKQGASITVWAEHPSFATPVTVTVPAQTTYDLSLLADLSAGQIGTTFTAGSVLFVDSGGLIQQDNSNLYYDDSLNILRLGNALRLAEVSAPGTPPANTVYVYAKSDGGIYKKDDAGTESAIGGFTDPMSARGDIIVRNSSNTTARLAVGASATFIRSNGTDPSWTAIQSGDLPGTISGDHTFSGVTKLGTGTNATVPEFYSSLFGDTATASLLADSTNAARVNNGVPSAVWQTWRSGTNGFIGFAKYIHTTATDGGYGDWLQYEVAANLTGKLTEVNDHAYRVTAKAQYTNVPASGANLYVMWGEARREGTETNVSVGFTQWDVYNAGVNAGLAVETAGYNRTFGNLIFGAGTHKNTSAFVVNSNRTGAFANAFEIGANGAYRYVFNLQFSTHQITGTSWVTDGSTTITISSGGQATTELLAGDQVTVNSVVRTVVTTPTDNSFTVDSAVSAATGLTITKKVFSSLSANNQYDVAINAAGTARYRFKALVSTDTWSIDPDARGITFGGITVHPLYVKVSNASVADPSDTLTSGWRLLIFDGGAGGRFGIGIGSATQWYMGPSHKFYTGSSTSPALVFTVESTGALTFIDNVRQTFNPGATNSGLNVGAHAGNPSSLSNGDLWYNSSTNELNARINGATIALGNIADGDKGDITVSGSGATWTIDNNVISDAKLRQGAALSVIGRSANSTGDPADIAAGSDHNILRRSGTALAFGSIDLSQSGAVGVSILGSANGGTGDAGTAWASYTPTVTAGTGSFTSVSASGRYKQIGKTVFVRIRVTITTNGTAASYVGASLPVAAKDQSHTMTGREDGITGKGLAGTFFPDTSTLLIRFYDDTYPGANGHILDMTGVYEAN